jgi:ergothioneine biosynthesis protein EgtC
VCRFIFYSGDSIALSSLVTEPENSLIHQSFASRERREPLNGDGFGVAWYAPDRGSVPGLFRATTPAWNNANLASLARVVSSPCILAHVRAASLPDNVSESNCHPFVADRLAFMHNGELGSFQDVRRPLLDAVSDEAFARIRGRTDSEHMFALLLDRLGPARAEASVDELGDALTRTLGEALDLVARHARGNKDSSLNIVVTTGRDAVATRFTTRADYPGESLYWIRGRECVCEDGVCRMKSPHGGGSAMIVSSERLDQDPNWNAVPRNHMVLLRVDGSADVRPLAL